MKYLMIVCLFYLAGCSVNKDVHDMGDRVSLLSNRVQQMTEELKKSRSLPGDNEMTDFISKQKQMIDAIPKVDISQKSEQELTEIATKAKRIIENPPPAEQTTVPPVDVQDPPTNIPPHKQALIYRIKAYLRQIFRRKNNGQ